jgi:acyl dehydratase
VAVDAGRALALESAPFSVEIERGRLRAFAAAVGETDPVHSDRPAAVAAGHRDVLMPPTYLFSIDLEGPEPFGYLADLDIDLSTVLHGEQAFTYHQPVYAGDVIDVRQQIVDVTAKTPAMDFLRRRSSYHRGGELVAEAESLFIVRGGGDR